MRLDGGAHLRPGGGSGRTPNEPARRPTPRTRGATSPRHLPYLPRAVSISPEATPRRDARPRLTAPPHSSGSAGRGVPPGRGARAGPGVCPGPAGRDGGRRGARFARGRGIWPIPRPRHPSPPGRVRPRELATGESGAGNGRRPRSGVSPRPGAADFGPPAREPTGRERGIGRQRGVGDSAGHGPLGPLGLGLDRPALRRAPAARERVVRPASRPPAGMPSTRRSCHCGPVRVPSPRPVRDRMDRPTRA